MRRLAATLSLTALLAGATAAAPAVTTAAAPAVTTAAAPAVTTAAPPVEATAAVDYSTDRAEQVAAYTAQRADRHARDVAAQAAAVAQTQAARRTQNASKQAATGQGAKRAESGTRTSGTKKTTTRPATGTATTAKAPKKAAPAKASGSLATVVNFALAQQGKPYVYGAAGPNAYDCSGLLVRSFAQIGISLYHQSERMVAGRPTVARANWVPGTVLHYPGHVALYIGGGKMVHASRAGKPVAVVAVYGSPTGYRIT